MFMLIVKMARTREIRIKLTPEEFEKVEGKSRTLGMTKSSLIRYLLLNTRISVELVD